MQPKIGRRVIVVGSSGAGKSTLARRLAELLEVAFVELDALHWEPNWTPAEREVFRERVRAAIAAESWVLDGNYTRLQQDLSWPAADTIVWLDLGLPTLLRRGVVRSWRRWRSGELLWGTNREHFWDHLRLWDPNKSLLSYTLTTHRAKRRTYEALMRDPRFAHVRFIRLRSTAEVERWIDTLQAARAHQLA